jgi:hypothetical protein
MAGEFATSVTVGARPGTPASSKPLLARPLHWETASSGWPVPAALAYRQHQRLRRLQVDGDVVGDLGREAIRDRFVEARTIGGHGQGVEPCWPDPPRPATAYSSIFATVIPASPSGASTSRERSGWKISTANWKAAPGASSGRYDAFSLRRFIASRLSRFDCFSPWAALAQRLTADLRTGALERC